jgi:hypothetical protein
MGALCLSHFQPDPDRPGAPFLRHAQRRRLTGASRSLPPTATPRPVYRPSLRWPHAQPFNTPGAYTPSPALRLEGQLASFPSWAPT